MPTTDTSAGTERYRAITQGNVAQTPQWSKLDPELQEAVQIVAAVLPFRTNPYVLEHLINWDNVPDDPMYQLTFPQRGMLHDGEYQAMRRLIISGAPQEERLREANRIRAGLNPHPAGQMTHNVPIVNGEPLHGLQHKYRETVLFFPSHGQTCHAYCTFCFRWAQFVGIQELRFSNQHVEDLVSYLKSQPDVTDVLFTGGDPMVMGTGRLRQYIEPLLDPSLEHVQNIRIGTKSVAYWPQRYVTAPDADDLMRLFEEVASAGRHLAIMGHYCHPVELSTDIAQQAVRRIRSAGAQIRMQSPMVRHVNDDADAWAALWKAGVRLGAIPYYMFVERDTGARDYFAIPLAEVRDIYRRAYRQVSGLARTVRGPTMSAFPGKVRVLGICERPEGRAFVLEYMQARNPDLVCRPFFARYDPAATWFDQLEPATENDRVFFPKPESSPRQAVPLAVGDTALA